MAVDGQLEEFVVSRIAARHNALGDRDQLGRSHQLVQPGLRVGIDQRGKIGARNFFGCERFEQTAAPLDNERGG
jgi:hypothetical protein